MDEDLENVKLHKAMDEVDFSSGYDQQYKEENRPLRPVKVVPPDPKSAWYRNLNTILMVIFLTAVFIGGSLALIMKIFTGSLMTTLIYFGIYLTFAFVLLFLEIKSIHVR